MTHQEEIPIMKTATIFTALAALALLAAASLQAQTVTGSGDAVDGLRSSDAGLNASGAAQDAPDATKPVAGSYACIAGGSLEIGGKAIVISDQLLATGSAPPAYSEEKLAESFKKTVALPEHLSLSLSAGPSADVAVSPGLEGGTVIATAGSAIRSASAVVTDPLIAEDVLKVSANEIESTATFVKSGAKPDASGTTTLAGLKIDLSLLGLGVHEYSGSPKPNTVLYKSTDGSVKIYLNRQITAVSAAADHSDASTATSITVDAVDVHLTDARIAGLSISGDIEIGTSYAE